MTLTYSSSTGYCLALLGAGLAMLLTPDTAPLSVGRIALIVSLYLAFYGGKLVATTQKN